MGNSTGYAKKSLDQHRTGQRLASLEVERHRMVQNVLQVLARCESADSSPGTEDAELMRRRLHAAVKDLEDLDEGLLLVRTRETPPQGPLPAV